MTDTTTQAPVRVSTDGTAGPYIRLSWDQVNDLKRLLDSHQIRYRVQENIISLNGGPFMAVVDLGRNADPLVIQRILDSVS